LSAEGFGTHYASFYDALYSEKDYEGECDLIELIVHRYGDTGMNSILDLGCGTGGHSIPLSQRGYTVTGVDRSEPMLAEARRKSSPSYPLEFVYGDLRYLKLGRQFDVVLMMFAVLGYQTNDDDLSKALNTVSNHINGGGLLIGDIWYGPAVVETQPSDRSKTVETKSGTLTRVATPTLDSVYNICTIDYQLELSGERESWEEQHSMRYFFSEELERHFEHAGIDLIALLPFPEIDTELSSATWNALFCGKAQ